MKNQLMIKDGSNLITLVSDNFFINYDSDCCVLEVRMGKDHYSFRNARTTTIPDGKSKEAVAVELAADIPVFRIAND